MTDTERPDGLPAEGVELPPSPLAWMAPGADTDYLHIVWVGMGRLSAYTAAISLLLTGLWFLSALLLPPLIDALIPSPYGGSDPFWLTPNSDGDTLFVLLVPAACLTAGALVFGGLVRVASGWRVRLRESVEWPGGRRELQRVDPWSVLLSAALVVSFAWLCPVACFFILGTAFAGPPPPDAWRAVIPIVAFGLEAALLAAVAGGLYNCLAAYWGGIRFTCEEGSPAARPPRHGETLSVRARVMGWLQPALGVGAAAGLVMLLIFLFIPDSRPPAHDAAWGYPVAIGGLCALGVGAGGVLLGAYAIGGWITGGTGVEVT